ncbi:MAG: hypothetical protein LUH07_10565 [Lachnospiraceae bacterium]|nr:hypothetical protein [Lachnospiraceae bacterium]
MAEVRQGEAEQELIELYTEKALNAYQAGKMAEAAHCAKRILVYDPEDVNALFLKGATLGRSSKPGNMHIHQAFQVWKPLMDRVNGTQQTDLYEAIRYAFAVMTESPVMTAFRFWSSYYILQTIESLRDVLQELTDLEQKLPEREDQKKWILPLFRENYSTWVYDIVGADLAIPSGSNVQLLDTFYEMLYLLYEMAKKMPSEQKGNTLLLKRTRLALVNFEKRNHSEEHPERLAYLAGDKNSL